MDPVSRAMREDAETIQGYSNRRLADYRFEAPADIAEVGHLPDQFMAEVVRYWLNRGSQPGTNQYGRPAT
jgi:hypothetical protein